MTPKEFLKHQYGIDTDKQVDEKGMIHPTFLSVVMQEYVDYISAYKAMEKSDEVIHNYKLKILEDIKLGFDLCSDTSAFCLGYRNLVDEIRRFKENKPIDKSISPVKPYKHE